MANVILNSGRAFNRGGSSALVRFLSNDSEKPISPRMQEFKKKLREKSTMEQLEDQPLVNPAQEKEPLKPWPNNTNPHTGEINGPKGPEPTRYGDWERKGRVSDF